MGRNKEKVRQLLLSISLCLPTGVWAGQETGSAVDTVVRPEGIMQLDTGAHGAIEQAPAPGAAAIQDQAIKSDSQPKDLTAFFVIGFIVNILGIGAFLYWAAGQWRKSK